MKTLLTVAFILFSHILWAQTDSTETVITDEIFINEIVEIEDNTKTEPTDSMVFEVFALEVAPQFKNGGSQGFMQFVEDSVLYPEAAEQADTSGYVIVVFIIDKTGSIKVQTTICDTEGYGFEQAAQDVVLKTSGMWEPATWRDKPVAMRMTVPISMKVY